MPPKPTSLQNKRAHETVFLSVTIVYKGTLLKLSSEACSSSSSALGLIILTHLISAVCIFEWIAFGGPLYGDPKARAAHWKYGLCWWKFWTWKSRLSCSASLGLRDTFWEKSKQKGSVGPWIRVFCWWRMSNINLTWLWRKPRVSGWKSGYRQRIWAKSFLGKKN